MHQPLIHSNLHYAVGFLVVGTLLLLLGRRLFWLFVAVAGFVVGIELTHLILPHQSEMVTLIVGLILGIIGAMLAIFVQKVSISIAGFVGGGYLAAVLCGPSFGAPSLAYPVAWLCFLVGGIAGAILMMAFFNWALIILSSLQGAHMIIRGIPTSRYHLPIIFVILAIIGIVVQVATYRKTSLASK